MDMQSIIAAVSIIGTGAGGYVGGRLTGRSSVSQVAVDTVDMLQTQVDLLERDKVHREQELSDLRSRVTVLEGLVTQRAEVEEVGARVILVKETVDRIAAKVGA